MHVIAHPQEQGTRQNINFFFPFCVICSNKFSRPTFWPDPSAVVRGGFLPFPPTPFVKHEKFIKGMTANNNK